MSNPSNFALRPGIVLAGKYRVDGVLGQGGMGVVAAVHHIQLDRRMALKLMLPDAVTSSEAVSRFLREARAAARITSEHVARVFDVGELDTGEPYIAMEFLEGTDIAQLIANQGRLSVEESIDYLLQACEALAEAHVAGIVHRDLKPSNLFLARRLDGQRLVKVLDFGIVKMTGVGVQSDVHTTTTSGLMGTPLYMSPEQMGSSKSVDARSDIWSLGVLLYEMLSGLPPFLGDTIPQVCGKVMTEDPPPLREVAPGLPQQLHAVVDRCLQKRSAARYQNIAELALALEPLASSRARQSVERILRVQGFRPSAARAAAATPLAAQTGTVPGTALPQPPAGTYAPWDATTRPAVTKKKTARLVLGLVALSGLGSLWLVQRSRESSPTGEPYASARSTTAAAGAPVAPTLQEELPIAIAPAVVTPSSASPNGSSTPPLPRAAHPHPATNVTKSARPSPSTAKPAAPPSGPVVSPADATPAPVSTRSRI